MGNFDKNFSQPGNRNIIENKQLDCHDSDAINGVLSWLSAKEQIPYVLLPHLRENLSSYFEDQICENAHIEVLNVSGFTGNFFKISSLDRTYFLKARSLDDQEIKVPELIQTRGGVAKERHFQELASQHGIPVTKMFAPVLVSEKALPHQLSRYHTRSVRGRSRPFILSLQEYHSSGNIGYNDFGNHKLQEKVYKSLGVELAKVNSISTNGFGVHYDCLLQSFSQTWKDRMNSMMLDVKLEELFKLDIFSSNDVLVLKRLLEPAFSLKPDSVLLHTDANPGNYKYSTTGEVSVILDWETAEGGPWQLEIAIQIGRIHSGTYRIPPKERERRTTAFLEGYGLSEEEFLDNKSIIDALRVADAVDRTHRMYVKLSSPPGNAYKQGAFLTQIDGSYQSVKTQEQPDWDYMALGREAALRLFIAKA